MSRQFGECLAVEQFLIKLATKRCSCGVFWTMCFGSCVN